MEAKDGKVDRGDEGDVAPQVRELAKGISPQHATPYSFLTSTA